MGWTRGWRERGWIDLERQGHFITKRFISGKADKGRPLLRRNLERCGQLLGHLPRRTQFIGLNFADGLSGIADLLRQLRLRQAQTAPAQFEPATKGWMIHHPSFCITRRCYYPCYSVSSIA